MRENKRKERKLNKLKLRNSTRIILALLFVTIFAISSASIFKSVSKEEHTVIQRDIYSYTNTFSSDYSINLKDNSFIEESSLPSGQTYVADLIDTINMQMHYKYTDSENLPITYTYKIDAMVNAKYLDNGTEYSIWNRIDSIKSIPQPYTSSDDISIDESIKINYDKYHQEALNFKQTFGMSADAFLYIKLTVNTSTTVNSQIVENEYTSNYCITIGDKIAVVEDKNNEEKTEYIKQENTNTTTSVNMPLLALNIVLMAISAYVIYFITYRTQKLNYIRNEFKLELNRILKSCETRIVIVENKPQSDEESTVIVKDFGELIKLSEELYKPILCWISNQFDHNEANFFVISNKVKYVFILKD